MLGLIYDTQYTVQISPINKSNTRTLLLRILNLIVKGEVSGKKSQHINLYNSFLSNTVSIQKKTSITLLHLKEPVRYNISIVLQQYLGRAVYCILWTQNVSPYKAFLHAVVPDWCKYASAPDFQHHKLQNIQNSFPIHHNLHQL